MKQFFISFDLLVFLYSKEYHHDSMHDEEDAQRPYSCTLLCVQGKTYNEFFFSLILFLTVFFLVTYFSLTSRQYNQINLSCEIFFIIHFYLSSIHNQGCY